MAIINGINMPKFTAGEFSEDPSLADTILLRRLQDYRTILDGKIYPSKEDGALARKRGRKTSTHFINSKKRSTGIDVFPDCNIFKAWTIALNCNLWAGVGVYFDTHGNNGQPWPMLHLDLRPSPLIWYRDDGRYVYPSTSKSFYYDLQGLLMLHGKGK
jgi:hypothetical protein